MKTGTLAFQPSCRSGCQLGFK